MQRGRSRLRFGEGEAEEVEESGEAEGLLEVLGAVGNLRLGDAFGVARHVNDFDVGTKSADFGSEVRTAKAGHNDIGQENVNFAGVRAGDVESVGRAGSFQNGVAALLKDFADGVAKGGFVIHEKDYGLRCDFGMLGGCRTGLNNSRRKICRKENFEASALP